MNMTERNKETYMQALKDRLKELTVKSIKEKPEDWSYYGGKISNTHVSVVKHRDSTSGRRGWFDSVTTYKDNYFLISRTSYATGDISIELNDIYDEDKALIEAYEALVVEKEYENEKQRYEDAIKRLEE